MTTDPIGYEGGINLYTYCHNDPVNYTDPWGYCEEEAPEDPEEMLDEEIEEELEELEKKKKDKEGLTPEEEERIKELQGEKERRKEEEGEKFVGWLISSAEAADRWDRPDPDEILEKLDKKSMENKPDEIRPGLRLDPETGEKAEYKIKTLSKMLKTAANIILKRVFKLLPK